MNSFKLMRSNTRRDSDMCSSKEHARFSSKTFSSSFFSSVSSIFSFYSLSLVVIVVLLISQILIIK